MSDGLLRGKTALVTGGARRLGRAISLGLAENGVNIVVHCSRSTTEAEELLPIIAEKGVKTWMVRADFEDHAETNALVGRAMEVAGSLDFLVNSAAIYLGGTIADVGFGDLMRHMQVNAWAPMVNCREFDRLAGKGKIVNILDTRVDGYDMGHAAYIVSKHALALLTEMAALSYAPRITVNAVSPGLILPPPGRDKSYLDGLATTVPLRTHGKVADVAEAVVYLLKSDFITGEVIHVDGGRHLSEYRDGQNPDK